MTELLSKPQEVDVASRTGGLTDAWFAAFRVHQAFEVRCVSTAAWLSVAVSCAWCGAYWYGGILNGMGAMQLAWQLVAGPPDQA